ncbi:MAG: hypothetical protein FWC68_00390 [Oscillospiraceae bacterium]|nr:hypothetical protein [Oscillospiraceae bacterium]
MENASKALIIAGEILLGVMLLSLAVYTIISMRSPSESYIDTIDQREIARFNSAFERLRDRNDLTVQDLVTARSFARANEERMGVTIVNVPSITRNGQPFNTTLPDEGALFWGMENHTNNNEPPLFMVPAAHLGNANPRRNAEGRIIEITFVRSN